MQQPTFDPGLTQQFTGVLRRSINKDGTFNVQRKGVNWRDIHPYLQLLNMTWTEFFGVVLVTYLAVNTLFAAGYFMLGPEAVMGTYHPEAWRRFMNDFFFSAHTLTTVGYGNMSPSSVAANWLSTFEALGGLLAAALGTGLLFGRFSRPSARIGFSERLLVAPYQDRSSLQFRVVNRRPNVIMDLTADVILMTVDGSGADRKRNFQLLPLERRTVFFLALTWTLVHPIDEASPLFGKTRQDLERLQAEIVILIKGFDDTFSQTVHARYSYRYDEFAWGARFNPAFEFDQDGNMVLNVDRVGSHALLEAAK